MGEVMSAAAMSLMTESAAMTKSTVTASKLVSIVTESTMIKSVTESAMIESVIKSVTVTTVEWMAPAAVGVSGISTAVAVTAAWVTYVIAALGRNQTNEERQSS
jgi:hypothetical protein